MSHASKGKQGGGANRDRKEGSAHWSGHIQVRAREGQEQESAHEMKALDGCRAFAPHRRVRANVTRGTTADACSTHPIRWRRDCRAASRRKRGCRRRPARRAAAPPPLIPLSPSPRPQQKTKQLFAPDNAAAVPSVLLFTDQERYLFNAAEGAQRVLRESKARISRVGHVFATRAAPSALGGLPGLLLSAAPTPGADGAAASAAAGLIEQPVAAHLYGPPGMRAYVDAFRLYAAPPHGVLRVHEAAAAAGGGGAEEGAAAGPPTPPMHTSGVVSVTPVLLQAVAAADEDEDTDEEEGDAMVDEEEEEAARAARKRAASGGNNDQDAAGGNDDTRPEQDSAGGKRAKTFGGDHPDALGARAGGVRRARPAANGGNGAGSNPDGSDAAAPQQQPPPPPACAWVCRLTDLPGKFDPAKAAAAGVPRGPLWGDLQRGRAVVSTSGATVAPAHVMSPPSAPGPVLIVVDCPTVAHARALAGSHELQRAAADSRGGSEASSPRLVVVAHLSPERVQRSRAYRRWVGSSGAFGAGARHLSLAAGTERPLTTRRAMELQARLHAVEPRLFPLRPFAEREGAPGAAEAARGAAERAHGVAAAGVEAPVVVPCGHMHRYTLAPARAQGLVVEDAPAQIDVAKEAAELLAKHPSVAEAVAAAAAAAKKQLQQQEQQQHPGLPACLAAGDRSQGALTLLGTCSAVPTHFRNVSSYLLETGGAGEEEGAQAADGGNGLPPPPAAMRAGLLLDCGEDCIGQLERVFGREGAAQRVARLAAVWVSHMHADHHGALYGLLERRWWQGQQRQQEPSAPAAAEPLLIIGPWPLFRVLTTYATAMPHLRDTFLFLPSPHLAARYAEHQKQQQGGAADNAAAATAATPARPPPPPHILAAYERAKSRLGLSELWAFHVEHVAHSFGLRVASAAGGWSMVASGDTRPCAAVERAARGATLLLHEATFDDELAHEAVAKRHSTVGEALGVARRAGVYRTLLTHFSTRYPRLPPPRAAAAVVEAEGGGGEQQQQPQPAFALAFDLMTVNLADLPSLPETVAPLDAMFRAAYEGDAAGAEE
jgi:ribonuclease Z